MMRRIVRGVLFSALIPSAAMADELCLDYDGAPEPTGPTAGMVRIDAGSFLMGSEARPYRPEEGPVRRVAVGAFWIDRHEVTNAQFAAFVEATGYRTLAETGLDPSVHPDMPDRLRQPGAMVFSPPRAVRDLTDLSQWWRYLPGANWRQPLGEGSSIRGLRNHPVVHIAFEDALAYARWRGRDLPTEAEWEYAARGGLDGADYTWGEGYDPVNGWKANTWQGEFPKRNTRRDGWQVTAPVGCYEPNNYGLYDMAGNVWEYVSDGWTPRPGTLAAPEDAKVTIKGGSWLCTPVYCGRYRPAARQPQEKSLGTNHIGFRTVLRSERHD